MKTAIVMLGFLLSRSLAAVEVPSIAVGDYLLVYAQIIACGPQPMAIEAAQVQENGGVTLFGDVSLFASDKSVPQVRDELVDEMEQRTGHRANSLEITHLPGIDKEAVAKRLVRFSAEVNHPCTQRVMPPLDPDEDWVITFEQLACSEYCPQTDSTGTGGRQTRLRDLVNGRLLRRGL